MRLDFRQVLGQLGIASITVVTVVNLAMAGRADRTNETGVVQSFIREASSRVRFQVRAAIYPREWRKLVTGLALAHSERSSCRASL